MKFWDLIKIANRNLFRNKLRTALTVTAIFVGSLTLVLTNALADGMRDFVDKQIQKTEGKNNLFITKKIENAEKKINFDEPREYKEDNEQDDVPNFARSPLVIPKSEIDSIIQNIPEIKSVTPGYIINGEYITLDGGKKYYLQAAMLSEGIVQKTEAGTTVNGTNQILLPLSLAKVFSPDINSLINREVTIGYKDAAKQMKTMRLKIVGILTKGLVANFASYVDSETARTIYEDQNRGTDKLNNFSRYTVYLKDGSEETVGKVKKILDEKGLKTETLDDQNQRQTDGIGIIRIALNFIAFIALFAASFGIINTLVIAVMERTKEIGLQKAMGMGKRTIFALFSIESVLIGFWGAVAGIVAGIVVGTITNLILSYKYADTFEEYTLFSFTLFSIIYVILLVSFIAFAAGVLPAFRASRLNPIEALRYE